MKIYNYSIVEKKKSFLRQFQIIKETCDWNKSNDNGSGGHLKILKGNPSSQKAT